MGKSSFVEILDQTKRGIRSKLRTANCNTTYVSMFVYLFDDYLTTVDLMFIKKFARSSFQ